MNRQIEARIDRLEALIKERVAALSGYASGHASLRHLLQLFRYSDQTDQGFITFKNFQEFMLRLNLVGAINRDIEHLFNRYDDDLLGHIDYKDFANTLYGNGSCEKLSPKAMDIMIQLRQAIVSNGMDVALRFCSLQEGFTGVDGRGFLSLSNAVRALSNYFQGAVSSSDLSFLLKFFDTERNNTVSTAAFMKEFKRGMSVERKRLVKSVFESLDAMNDGVIVLHDLQRCYALHKNTHILYDYVMRGYELPQFMNYLQCQTNSHRIPWTVFLDYYRVVSLGVDDDNFFDFYIRNSWEFGGGKVSPHSVTSPGRSGELMSPSFSKTSIASAAGGLVKRRILVIHSDGSQRVVEIMDELGATRLDGASLLDTLSQMGINDVHDIRL